MLFYHSNYSVEQCDKLRILHLSHPQGSPLNFPFSSSMLLCYQILCIFSLLHFTPPCGFMLFSIIYYFFSSPMLSSSLTHRTSQPHLSHHPPHLFLPLHSHTLPLLFPPFSPSTITSNSHHTGIPIPMINNAKKKRGEKEGGGERGRGRGRGRGGGGGGGREREGGREGSERKE